MRIFLFFLLWMSMGLFAMVSCEARNILTPMVSQSIFLPILVGFMYVNFIRQE